MSFTCAKSVVTCIFECWLIENVIHHCNLRICMTILVDALKRITLFFFLLKSATKKHWKIKKRIWEPLRLLHDDIIFRKSISRSCFFFSIPMLTFFNVKNVFWFKIESIWYMIYLKPELIIEQQSMPVYLSESGPFLAIIILSLPKPPTGALSVPVVNWRNSLFCSCPNECTVSQKSLMSDKNIILNTLLI